MAEITVVADMVMGVLRVTVVTMMTITVMAMAVMEGETVDRTVMIGGDATIHPLILIPVRIRQTPMILLLQSLMVPVLVDGITEGQ